MSNTNLPRVPAPEDSVFSPGHWVILFGAILTLAGIIGFHTAVKPPVRVPTRVNQTASR